MSSTPLRLLIAEDVEDDALLTIDNLSQQFAVSYKRVQSAEPLRALLQSDSWDLVISDWDMPTLNALQALKIAQEADPDLPFIIVSGTVGEDMAVRAMEIGAHDYLMKDNLTRLNAAVTRELRESQIRREHRRALCELKERAEELYRSNRELERFAYVAAHDLQEPLRTISSYSELLLRLLRPHLNQASQADEFVSFVREGVERMENLIQGLLTYSKVVHDGDQNFQLVDSRLAVADALKQLDGSVQDAGAAVMVDSLPIVRADRLQLAQVFQNLISNSIKYRRKDVPLAVHVSAVSHGQGWQFAVRDNGIGISSDHYERIFYIFKRLHRDEYPGLGIGLALAKRLVESHGGRIWVESRVGEGSTFFFTVADRASGNPEATQ